MESSAIALPAMMDINACAVLHSTILEHSTTTGTLELDGSGVERVSTPGVQLLLCAAKSIHEQGKAIRLHAASQPLSQAIDDLGLNLVFNMLFTDSIGAGKEPL
jgi:anti-anti-sigma regulatory factor